MKEFDDGVFTDTNSKIVANDSESIKLLEKILQHYELDEKQIAHETEILICFHRKPKKSDLTVIRKRYI